MDSGLFGDEDVGVLGMATTDVLYLDVDETKIYVAAFQQRYLGIRVEMGKTLRG